MGSQNGYEDERHLSKSFDDMQLSEFLGSRAVPGPIINLEGKPIPEQFTGGDEQEYIVDRGHWKRWVPEWIRLPHERAWSLEESLADPMNRFPPLESDPLFMKGDSALIPFYPSNINNLNRGAVIICPGGNLEYLHPREGTVVARWVAETLGIPAFVLRYRLLPDCDWSTMISDFHKGVRLVRQHANGGPVVSFGFSAGGYLCSAAAATFPDKASRPDGLVLVYPSCSGEGWSCFHRIDASIPQVKSLEKGRQKLREGPRFVKPPPLFVVASLDDDCCPPETESDPYVDAARLAGTSVTYLRDNFGGHGFGLKQFWTGECEAWLRNIFGVIDLTTVTN